MSQEEQEQQQNFWTHFFPDPKRCLEGENKASLSFLNWQRTKVLLKLEFDTEDQVLLSLGWCFIGVLGGFHKYLECASRSFYECLQKDSNVCASCFKGVLGCLFVKKRFILHTKAMAATHANSNGKKGPKNTPGTLIAYSRITLKHSLSNSEVPLKHP